MAVTDPISAAFPRSLYHSLASVIASGLPYFQFVEHAHLASKVRQINEAGRWVMVLKDVNVGELEVDFS